jgi:hypothetical protein
VGLAKGEVILKVYPAKNRFVPLATERAIRWQAVLAENVME